MNGGGAPADVQATRRTMGGEVAARLLTGPVAITGASGQVGTALVRRLAGLPNEVRALGRRDDLAAAFRDADSVVHLAGTLRPRRRESYVEANLRTIERTVSALEGSTVERVVFLSYVGASTASPNAYLRAKGEAEAVLHRSGRDPVVFRCTHIYGPPEEPGPTVSASLARKGGTASVLGTGAQRLAPVYRDDVVEAIVAAALDPRTPHGRFDLPGPDIVTMDEFVMMVNRRSVKLRHIPPFLVRTLGHALPALTPELVDVMLSDSLGEATRAERAFGLNRRHLADVYGAGGADLLLEQSLRDRVPY